MGDTPRRPETDSVGPFILPHAAAEGSPEPAVTAEPAAIPPPPAWAASPSPSADLELEDPRHQSLPPLQPASAPPPGFVAPQAPSSPCAHHPGNAAVGVCDRCGDFICRLCATPIEGRVYCPRCFELLFDRGSLGFKQRAFHRPAIAATTAVLALLGSVIPCYGLAAVPTGAIAIWVAVLALREIDRSPDLPGRRAAVVAIWLGSLAALVTLSETALFIWLLTRVG